MGDERAPVSVYVDTSVVLATLLAEDRRPPREFWNGSLVSSRLLEYEAWTRLHAERVSAAVEEAARCLIASTAMVELTPRVLARALEPFPAPVRTVDALHLATATYLAEQGMRLRVATYDARLAAAAAAVGLTVYAP